MKYLHFVTLLLAAGVSTAAYAQDLDAYKKHVEVLSSEAMEGRGYVNDGVLKAERYIVDEYRKAGVDDILLQPFTIDINTFPGNTDMSVDGRKLCPGDDFLVREYSAAAKGHYKLVYIDTLGYDGAAWMKKLSSPKYKDYYGVLDLGARRQCKEFRENGDWNKLPLAGMIYKWSDPLKFYKAAGERVSQKPVLWVSNDFPTDARSIDVDIENEFRPAYESHNVIARVKGERSDSTFVVVGHYDHLGHFGRDMYYPGVNDNASGVAAMLTLAKYFAANKPRFDVVFISFAGEEAGLRGSSYYAEHQAFPVDNIKYVVNLDMIGDNAPEQYCEVSDAGEAGFALMKEINAERGFFTHFDRGALASNSDHYPFAELGVPCIGFIQEGGDCFAYYHTHRDDMEHAIYDTYPKIFSLIVELFGRL
uniref:Peptidase M28 domain-containing protein n=1 Tax=uncultured bacterium fosmid pJB89E1 TaxID=1478073 RepID=A0A0H3UA13_9BACT|nr:hypothetical protein [uncultured bacterium fosmid pJB89E1]